MDNSDDPQEKVAEALASEARRIEEDATYSAKGHFLSARAWTNWHFWIGIPNTIVAALAGVSALNSMPRTSAVLALFVAATSAVFTFLNPKERASGHLAAGNSYQSLRNNARMFREIECRLGRTPAELSIQLGKLNEQRNALNSESPQIPYRAFTKARHGIEAGETRYEVDQSSRGSK